MYLEEGRTLLIIQPSHLIKTSIVPVQNSLLAKNIINGVQTHTVILLLQVIHRIVIRNYV